MKYLPLSYAHIFNTVTNFLFADTHHILVNN
jgi:hypothetical protein